jgi:hypothetical protein
MAMFIEMTFSLIDTRTHPRMAVYDAGIARLLEE